MIATVTLVVALTFWHPCGMRCIFRLLPEVSPGATSGYWLATRRVAAG